MKKAVCVASGHAEGEGRGHIRRRIGGLDGSQVSQVFIPLFGCPPPLPQARGEVLDLLSGSDWSTEDLLFFVRSTG